MSSTTSPNSIRSGKRLSGRVGIIGAGQLARMLAEAAMNFGLRPHILAKRADDPAAQLDGVDLTIGTLDTLGLIDEVTAGTLASTFESELVPQEILAGLGSTIYPSPKSMSICSNKLSQKECLREANIPTSEWDVYDPGQSPADWLRALQSRFPEGAVMKWATGGYDGRGNFFLPKSGYDESAAKAFIASACERNSSVYGERLIPFVYELAVVSTRSTQGDFAQLPPVLTFQERGICSTVRGPASSFGVSQESIHDVLRYAKQIGQAFDIVGSYAVEFFVHENGAVSVNEIAPRVHNSGHFSQDSADCSQFANHWLALLGEPLGSTQTPPYFAMVNILGASSLNDPQPFTMNGDGIFCHWYGKKELRFDRKMGHVNISAESEGQLENRVQEVQAAIQDWQEELK